MTIRNYKKEQGFTLVEILIVVAITSILVGVAVPTLNNAKAKAQEVKRNTIQTSVETAKNRYVLSKDNISDYANKQTTFQHIQPYLLISGKAPENFQEIGDKTKNQAGANIIDLGSYWGPNNPAISMSWGEDPYAE
jgi:hypothetical protein